MLYIGMARVKSHVIRIQNASKLGENHSLGLQNTLAIIYGPISTYTCSQRPHTHLPLLWCVSVSLLTQLHFGLYKSFLCSQSGS